MARVDPTIDPPAPRRRAGAIVRLGFPVRRRVLVLSPLSADELTARLADGLPRYRWSPGGRTALAIGTVRGGYLRVAARPRPARNSWTPCLRGWVRPTATGSRLAAVLVTLPLTVTLTVVWYAFFGVFVISSVVDRLHAAPSSLAAGPADLAQGAGVVALGLLAIWALTYLGNRMAGEGYTDREVWLRYRTGTEPAE